jgi:hypothetical protein
VSPAAQRLLTALADGYRVETEDPGGWDATEYHLRKSMRFDGDLRRIGQELRDAGLVDFFANGSGGFTINDKGRAALPELNGVGNADPLYVIAGGSDGYFAKIVSGSELDDAYLAALFGTAEGAGDQRVDLLRQLRDPDGWTCGGQSFMERFEDGWLYIFRLTEPPAVPSQVNSAMELDYKEWASILASILKATRPHVAASTLPGSNVPTLLSNLDGILESYGQDAARNVEGNPHA